MSAPQLLHTMYVEGSVALGELRDLCSLFVVADYRARNESLKFLDNIE